MDTTGSMEPYIEQVKKNLIHIINSIPTECPGIDINLGFIGYTEYEQIETLNLYTNIEFTDQYYYVEQIIKEITAQGGMGDGPEDVAWAMEMALKKNWKSNAKFVIYVADYPCHGEKYNPDSPKDLFPNGAPNRKEIETLIKDLANKGISLFCIKITDFTRKMFEMFEETYNQYPNCDFKIIPMNSAEELTGIVIDSSVEVYVSQRNN